MRIAPGPVPIVQVTTVEEGPIRHSDTRAMENKYMYFGDEVEVV